MCVPKATNNRLKFSTQNLRLEIDRAISFGQQGSDLWTPYNQDRNEALHHCTLLVNADIEVLNKVLKSKDPRIETAATRSLRVDVKCLSDIGISGPTDMDTVRDQSYERIPAFNSFFWKYFEMKSLESFGWLVGRSLWNRRQRN